MSEYIELHSHSTFSMLDGASSPEALVARAAAVGYRALALTDHNGLYGAVRFWRAARERGLRPIIGAEVVLAGGGHLTLLAENGQGYANLCRLISTGQLAGQKGHPRLEPEVLAEHALGLLCLSGCRLGQVPAALLAGEKEKACRAASWLRDLFGPGRFWLEVQRHYLPADIRLVAALVRLARRLGIGLVATNNVHYAQRSGQWLHDVLTCIRRHTNLPEALAGGLLHPNSEQFLKSPQEMVALFSDLPDAQKNTLRIAERCDVSLDFSAQRLPTFPVPKGHTLQTYLRALCKAGLEQKFNPVTPQARAQLTHELAVIESTGLAGYFLVVWDIVRFSREQGIRCQGRGSAANSLVAYLLDITPVDPLRHNLLFERFLSESAPGQPGTMPDIDVDFAADRREEVIQYVYNRYGQECVAMVCNVVTYRARSAVRDAAKALAFPPDIVDHVAKALDTRSTKQAATELFEGELPSTPMSFPRRRESMSFSLPWQILADVLRQMDGVPRHLSIHVGGLLITAAPLIEIVPLERATMPGRVVVQWDKDSVEDAGLIKIDLLSLRTLGVIEEAIQHMREWHGIASDGSVSLSTERPKLAGHREERRLATAEDVCPRDPHPDLDCLPLDDPAVYDLLHRADTVGCFQVESRAQAQMLPKMMPVCFEDLIIEVALVRPGPIQGGMVHPYLRRRQGLEPAHYAHPALEPALSETLGVIVFQEQVIRVAMDFAGFSPSEADQLRRAMSRSRSQEAMDALREQFLRGAQGNGVGRVVAEEVFHQLAGFAGFGFCKSHAAAFAKVAYQTLYLKAHFPAAFTCALLNHQPMGFYPPKVLIGDARRHGVPILQPDVNLSQVDCTLEQASSLAIRLGLSYVRGLGEAWQTHIVERREGRPFQSLKDFCYRTRLSRSVVENLIRAGAMEGLGGARRDLLWELGGLIYEEESLDLEALVDPVALPTLSEAERLAWEYELLGLAPGDHVMDLYRARLQARGILSSGELAQQRDGQRVRVAGLVVVRQRPPTAKGHVFITLEDEEGLTNLIVRPNIFEQYRAALRNAPLLWAEGRLQREGRALSVLVYRAEVL